MIGRKIFLRLSLYYTLYSSQQPWYSLPFFTTWYSSPIDFPLQERIRNFIDPCINVIFPNPKIVSDSTAVQTWRWMSAALTVCSVSWPRAQIWSQRLNFGFIFHESVFINHPVKMNEIELQILHNYICFCNICSSITVYTHYLIIFHITYKN